MEEIQDYKTNEDKKIISKNRTIDAHKIVSTNNSFNLKEGKNNFIYLEKQSINSIAFVLFARNVADERRIGLMSEYKNSIEMDFTTAFNTPVKDDKKEDLRELVIDKCSEFGFNISTEDVEYLGEVFASENSNEFCYLFGASVDKLLQEDIVDRGISYTIQWVNFEEASKTQDWKTLTILFKKMTSKQFIFVSR
jgi:hypothetical protein